MKAKQILQGIFTFLFIFTMGLTIAWAGEVKVGKPAPDFSAKDDRGKTVALKDFLGKTVILYFYPKDDTPGCILEAEGFRDLYSKFQSQDAVILGVSYDSETSHQEFKTKYKLPFILLVDSDKKISQLYGSEGEFFPSRDTFMIGPEGQVQGIYRNVNPAHHAAEVLKSIP